MTEWEYKLMDYIEGKLSVKEQKRWIGSTFRSKKKLNETIHLARDLVLLETLSLEPIPKNVWQKTFVEKAPPRIVLELLENSFHLIENTFSSSINKEILSYREQFYEVERMLFETQDVDLLLIPLSQTNFSLEIQLHTKKTDKETDKKHNLHLQLFELTKNLKIKDLGIKEMQKIKKIDKQNNPSKGRMIASFKTLDGNIQVQNIAQGDYVLEIDRKTLHIHIHSKRPEK